jgi:mono/diheme cytochrome c family protein
MVRSARSAGTAALAACLATLALACATALDAGSAGDDPDLLRELRFVGGEGEAPRRLTLASLRAACGSVEVEVDDPYHGRRMRYVGLPLRCVLDRGFADSGGAAGLREKSLLLSALDGYTLPVPGEELLEPGGVLAYGEPGLAESEGDTVPPFSPIDRRRIDPAPFYLVWSESRGDAGHAAPWPYQLVAIEVARFESRFSRTVPQELDSDDPGWQGYAIFQRACASCHAINGQGGTIGPELNVPRSIVEYRPEGQIKAYIRDPQSFRYTSMPAHPELDERELDALIAYFRAMSRRKQDPRAGGDS